MTSESMIIWLHGAKFNNRFNHFYTSHECDGQTDERTEWL